MNAAHIVKAIDDPQTALHAHVHVRPQAIAIAHAAICALLSASSPPDIASPSDISESYDMARKLVKAASDNLMQVRRETLTAAAHTLFDLR